MKAVVATFNQEKALVVAFSVIVQPLVEPMDRFTALPRSGYSDITQLAAYTTPRVVLSEEKTAAIYGTQYSSLTIFYWCLSSSSSHGEIFIRKVKVLTK